MFDIGFSEILITMVVALLVLGPERLPRAARFAGLWVRRARAQWASVRAELERELATEELQRNFHSPLSELQPQMRELEKDLREALAGSDFRTPPATAESSLEPQLVSPASPHAPHAPHVPASPSSPVESRAGTRAPTGEA